MNAAQEVEKPDFSAEGAAPIVVIGTTRDPATPYEWAEKMAGTLDSGVLLIREGEGHTGFEVGNKCIDDTVYAYLVDGAVPEDGKRCTNEPGDDRADKHPRLPHGR